MDPHVFGLLTGVPDFYMLNELLRARIMNAWEHGLWAGMLVIGFGWAVDRVIWQYRLRRTRSGALKGTGPGAS